MSKDDLVERRRRYIERQIALDKNAVNVHFHIRAPDGTGPANRHGMPKLPVGQHEVDNWPVLDLGEQPQVSLEAWKLEVGGLVDNPFTLTWEQFLALPQVEDVSDFHCVTTWSWVDRERARFSAWYEMFPRSAGPDPTRSGTFHEACALLPRIADLGFDVVYLPPIHPIGTSFRKGRNNSLTAGPEDPGSPWAIGSEAGGHTAVDPGLGTLADFAAFRQAAERQGLEIALDLGGGPADVQV